MIKTLTTVRCDLCGRKFTTSQGDHEKVKATFRTYGWTFPGDRCYCKNCSKENKEDVL